MGMRSTGSEGLIGPKLRGKTASSEAGKSPLLQPMYNPKKHEESNQN